MVADVSWICLLVLRTLVGGITIFTEREEIKMGKEFKQGQKLSFLRGPTDSEGDGVYFTTDATHPYTCVSIEVVMEYGQMAGVPWALVTFENKPPVKVNLAFMEEVGLLDESEA